MSLSEDGHYTVEDMSIKPRWNAWKRLTGVAVNNPNQSYSAAASSREGQDVNLWDNNDASFLREVALENRQDLATSPPYSENALETIASLAGSSSNQAAPHGHLDGFQQSSLSAALALAPTRRSRSAAGATKAFNGSLSASASDVSSAFTSPSPRSSKVEYYNRNRISESRFSGSYDTSPTTASFSSREVKNNYFPSEILHDGWTEEPFVDDRAGLESEVLLTSLPEEPSLNQYSHLTKRRSSEASLNFVPSSSFTTTSKNTEPVVTSKNATSYVETNPTTDYSVDRPLTSFKTNPFSTISTSPKISFPAAKKSGLVAGLKKKLGNTLRSTGGNKSSTPKESPSTDTNATLKKSALTTMAKEVQIVSADAMSDVGPQHFFPLSSREAATTPKLKDVFPSANQSIMSSSMTDQSKTTSEGHARFQTQSSVLRDERTNASVESFLRRSSALLSHSRSSSRASVIEHTSFDEARRQSGVYSAGSSSSQHHFQPQRRKRGSQASRQEEEREELRGDHSPLTTLQDLPLPHQGLLRSPARPARLFEKENASPTKSSRDLYSTQTSLESDFNAAHDKRWSTAGATFYTGERRRGSDVGVRRSRSSRRGDDERSYQNHGDFSNRAYANSLHSKRTSWHQTIKSDAIVPGRKSSLNATSKGSQSRNNQRSLLSSPRWTELMIQPVSHRTSLTSAQISRPTSVVGGPAATLAENIAPESEQSPAALSSSFADRDGRIALPTQCVAHSDTVVGPLLRQSRSAGGRVELLSSDDATLEKEASTLLLQQESQHLQSPPTAPKRPTFGLEMQPNVAAAFDCIPSPNARRIRTLSNPTVIGLSMADDATSVESTVMSSSALPLTPGREEGEGKEVLLSSPGDCEEEEARGQSNVEVYIGHRSHPVDAPHSPVLDELELLDEYEDDGSSPEMNQSNFSERSSNSSSSTSTIKMTKSTSNRSLNHTAISNEKSPIFRSGFPTFNAAPFPSSPSQHQRHQRSNSFTTPLMATLPPSASQEELPWKGLHVRASSVGIQSQVSESGCRRSSYSYL
ncbi:hypothetical protein CBS101457_002135 [Exobasidium rhododendri]|nr:hypothetical protein CBS101457_002135 [Exobasidium rhododendri]